MAFRFSLEAVLHLRQSLEHQQELRLRAANQQVARIRRMTEQMENQVRQMHAQQSNSLHAGTTAAEMRFSLECEATLQSQRLLLQGEAQRLERLRDQQQKIFQQARRERETIESLRDRQRSTYEREQARREQRQLDESFLLLRQFRRRQSRA